jgi:glutathione S-transferase
MKLHFNPVSPFVRKALVVAHERGLAAQITLLPRAMSPVTPDEELNRDNPLGKIPCLITDDGLVLYDSRVICAYLDSLGQGPELIPAGGSERWAALRREALGDGIMDAGVGMRYETVLRPEGLRWADWIAGQKGKIARALDALEAEAQEVAPRLHIGTIAIGCALGYLDFRFADDRWRERRPRLAEWFATFAERASMRATAPA